MKWYSAGVIIEKQEKYFELNTAEAFRLDSDDIAFPFASASELRDKIVNRRKLIRDKIEKAEANRLEPWQVEDHEISLSLFQKMLEQVADYLPSDNQGISRESETVN